jgi:hypothetical protein
MDTPARIHCIACAWMVYDPRFRAEGERYFPSDSTDRRIEWRKENPGYDLYQPRSAACQLKISVSFFRYSVSHDEAAPVLMGRGLIACNTPALQSWWNGKKHYSAGSFGGLLKNKRKEPRF